MSNSENVSVAHALTVAAEAAQNEARAVTLNLAASHELRQCFDREVITVEALKGKSVTTWAGDDECIRAALAAVLADQKLDKVSIDEALKAYAGNVLRHPEEEAKLRNAAKRAANAVTLMASVAFLERVTGASLLVDAKGMPAIPMAWFLPEDAEDMAEHDALLGSHSPWRVPVEPNGPNGRRPVYYLSKRGAGDLRNAMDAHAKAIDAWKSAGSKRKDRPADVDPLAFIAFVNGGEAERSGINVSAKSINDEARTRRQRIINARLAAEAAKRAEEAAKARAEADAKREEAAKEANAARKAAAEEAARAAERAAEAAKVQAEAAEAARAAAAAKAPQGRATRVAGDSKPQGAGANGDPGTSLTRAAEMLWKAISADDYKRTFAAGIATELRTLADHVWMHPQMTEIFLASREETLKRQAAEKREGSKAA